MHCFVVGGTIIMINRKKQTLLSDISLIPGCTVQFPRMLDSVFHELALDRSLWSLQSMSSYIPWAHNHLQGWLKE